MGNATTRQNKRQEVDEEAAVEQQQQQQQQQQPLQTIQRVTAHNNVNSGSCVTAEAQQQLQQQHQSAATASRQLSTCSLGSLSGGRRLNWSFSGARNSFRHRNKATRKSLTSLQGSKRCKTQWHRPITNSIFNSHFKESSRNEEFCIEHLVAKGAFGVVFKVSEKETNNKKDNSSQSSYALKVLKKSKLIEENSVQQIKDEADIQKVCGHNPFIVQQIDLWQNRHNLHILSEYVPNGELFSKISQFSIDLVRLYVAEIALAIDFLHNAGIIYRDAKPENILLTQQYHIKLTDFGLSKWLKLGANTRTMCGTFKYMAPEILCGEPYGHAVDWWALGVIACQMLTQKCPNIKRHLLRQQQRSQRNANPSIGGDDGSECLSNAPSIAQINGCLQDSDSSDKDDDFLPESVKTLSHEGQDVLRRLLAIGPRERIRSVMQLQRIALYKNYQLDAKRMLKLSPKEIIERDGIRIYEDNQFEQCSSELATKAFHNF